MKEARYNPWCYVHIKDYVLPIYIWHNSLFHALAQLPLISKGLVQKSFLVDCALNIKLKSMYKTKPLHFHTKKPTVP